MIRVGKVTVARWLTMERPAGLKSYIAFHGLLYDLHALRAYSNGDIKPRLTGWAQRRDAEEQSLTLNDSVYLCQAGQSLTGELLSKVKVSGLANVPPDCFALRGGDGDAPSDQAPTVNSMHHAWSLTGSTSDSAP